MTTQTIWEENKKTMMISLFYYFSEDEQLRQISNAEENSLKASISTVFMQMQNKTDTNDGINLMLI